MQILLGAQETIIKINSDFIRIEYIQNFIYKNFSDACLNKRILYIPESTSDKNSHYRIFLLKWIYALYAKKREQNNHEFKEVLLKRYYKAIKIILSSDILYKIIWTTIDANNIKFVVEPKNWLLLKALEKYFQNILHVTQQECLLQIMGEKDKERVKHFIKTSNVLEFKYENVYNKEDLKEFLSSPLQKAHKILGTQPGDDAYTLKKRYKTLAKKYHPDKANSSDYENILFYTQKFQNILEAYETLLQEVS